MGRSCSKPELEEQLAPNPTKASRNQPIGQPTVSTTSSPEIGKNADKPARGMSNDLCLRRNPYLKRGTLAGLDVPPSMEQVVDILFIYRYGIDVEMADSSPNVCPVFSVKDAPMVQQIMKNLDSSMFKCSSMPNDKAQAESRLLQADLVCPCLSLAFEVGHRIRFWMDVCRIDSHAL